MSYTTAINVRTLYPALDDVVRLTDGQINFYIEQADAEIDGYLSVRYTLPFSTTPALVRTIATEYALVKIMDRFFSAEAPDENDWKEVRRRELKNLLKSIASGSVLLVNSNSAIISGRTDMAITSDTKDYVPTFNHLPNEMQVIDTDRLDDEEDTLR